MKRALDILVGTFLAALTLPVVLVLAVGCAISLRAWPFFVQQRVGRGGKPFPLPKLRTLPMRIPTTLDKYELEGERIPRFCRLLRRCHLDELPQLLVVPLGWMSLVGPRPEMPALLGRYPKDFAAARGRVRPGCTGLWQISTASAMLIYEAPLYDLVYTEYQGLRLDVWILYRTVRMLTSGRASIDLSDLPRWALRRSYRARPAVSNLAAAQPESSIVIALEGHDAAVAEFHGRGSDSPTLVEFRDDAGLGTEADGVAEAAGHHVVIELRSDVKGNDATIPAQRQNNRV